MGLFRQPSPPCAAGLGALDRPGDPFDHRSTHQATPLWLSCEPMCGFGGCSFEGTAGTPEGEIPSWPFPAWRARLSVSVLA